MKLYFFTTESCFVRFNLIWRLLILGKMLAEFKSTYNAIDSIETKIVWQTHIYRTNQLQDIDTVLDCSFLCKNVEKSNNCELFAFVNKICYLGKSDHSEGNVEQNLENITIYISEGKQAITFNSE